jgi:tetratricopeptide (TPR) repeat protein
MVKLLALTLFLSVVWTPVFSPSVSVVQAQEGDARDQATARRLFKQGLSLAQSQRWAQALSAFRRSADLVPRASTSYNIANALYRLGRPADALVELDHYSAMDEVQADPIALQREAGLRAVLNEAVAQVRFAITPSDATLFIDGRVSSMTGFERLVRLNPGTHSLRVVREGYASAMRELRAERGSREYYSIALDRTAPPASEPLAIVLPGGSAAESAQDDRKPFVKRPGFWVMIGAIVVVGVGVGVAVALTRNDDAPQCGTTGNCATTQGLTLTSF